MFSFPQGLKTGMYYLRSRPAANAIQFTVDQKVVMETRQKQQQKQMAEAGSPAKLEGGKDQAYEDAVLACSRQNREACTMCSA